VGLNAFNAVRLCLQAWLARVATMAWHSCCCALLQVLPVAGKSLSCLQALIEPQSKPGSSSADSGARHLHVLVSGGCWRGPETLAFGFSHVLEHKRTLSVVSQTATAATYPLGLSEGAGPSPHCGQAPASPQVEQHLQHSPALLVYNSKLPSLQQWRHYWAITHESAMDRPSVIRRNTPVARPARPDGL